MLLLPPFPSALQSSSAIILSVLFASVVVETPAIRSRIREEQDTTARDSGGAAKIISIS